MYIETIFEIVLKTYYLYLETYFGPSKCIICILKTYFVQIKYDSYTFWVQTDKEFNIRCLPRHERTKEHPRASPCMHDLGTCNCRHPTCIRQRPLDAERVNTKPTEATSRTDAFLCPSLGRSHFHPAGSSPSPSLGALSLTK